MAKKKGITEEEMFGEITNGDDIREGREIYPTGFRNIDTNVGYRVYNDKDDSFVQINRGILSGSWVSFIGVTHTGKTTLAYQMLGTMMRPFVVGEKPDLKVKLYVYDIENGCNRQRFKDLTNFDNRMINNHVRWATDMSIEGLMANIDMVINEKSQGTYKPYKKKGSTGVEDSIYPPTFFMIDSFSLLVPRDALEAEELANTADMKQNLKLHAFIKNRKVLFAKYNINIFAISHIGDEIAIDMFSKPVKQYKALPQNKKIKGGKAMEYGTDIGIFLARIEAGDAKGVENAGATHLGVKSIIEAKIYKNRQGFDNVVLYFANNDKGKFDQIKSFLYECKKYSVIKQANGMSSIEGTDYSCRNGKLLENFISDAEYRKALFDKYDELKNDQLESSHTTKKEREETAQIIDMMMM